MSFNRKQGTLQRILFPGSCHTFQVPASSSQQLLFSQAWHQQPQSGQYQSSSLTASHQPCGFPAQTNDGTKLRGQSSSTPELGQLQGAGSMARARESREGELGGPSPPLGTSSMSSAHHGTDTSLPTMEEFPTAARLGCPASAKSHSSKNHSPTWLCSFGWLASQIHGASDRPAEGAIPCHRHTVGTGILFTLEMTPHFSHASQQPCQLFHT